MIKRIPEFTKSIWVKIAIALIALVLFNMLAGLMFPVLFAIGCSFALYPLTKYLRSIKVKGRSLPNAVVIAITFLLIGLALYLLIIFLIIPLFKEINELIKHIPMLTGDGKGAMPTIISQERMDALPSNIRDALGQTIRGISQSVLAVAKTLVASTFGVAASALGMFIVPFLVFYFLRDWTILRRMFVGIFDKNSRSLVHKITREVGQSLCDYTVGMMKMCLIAGLCLAAITALINPTYAMLMGTMGAVMELIPFVGPLFCTVTAVFLVFTSTPNLVPHIFFGFVIYYILDSQVLLPQVMNKSLTIPPVVIILTVLIGGKAFGITGLFFAVPVLCVAKVLYKNLWHRDEE
jgi:predicted PurR-regulated permease PerM